LFKFADLLRPRTISMGISVASSITD
jgi:hypothetical protein